jgi:hypothetical protein
VRSTNAQGNAQELHRADPWRTRGRGQGGCPLPVGQILPVSRAYRARMRE